MFARHPSPSQEPKESSIRRSSVVSGTFLPARTSSAVCFARRSGLEIPRSNGIFFSPSAVTFARRTPFSFSSVSVWPCSSAFYVPRSFTVAYDIKFHKNQPLSSMLNSFCSFLQIFSTNFCTFSKSNASSFGAKVTVNAMLFLPSGIWPPS